MIFNNTIFAHRGIHDNVKIPENSIKAFEEAVKFKVNIELDLQLTKDNELVVFHDQNLERMTGINKNMQDITFDEIKKLKLLNTDYIIPKFSEILKLIDGKVILNIEIKDTKKINLICKKIIDELKNYNHKLIIQSFNPRIIRKIKRLKQDLITGLLIKENYYNSFLGVLLIKYSKPNFLSISKKYIKKKGINKFFKKYPIFIWTIKSKDEFDKYNSITNNFICNKLPF